MRITTIQVVALSEPTQRSVVVAPLLFLPFESVISMLVPEFLSPVIDPRLSL